MGGSISVESATGKGTRFEVVLEFPIDTEADTVPKGAGAPGGRRDHFSPVRHEVPLCRR